jgi:2-amino-4-hydroxy-6-hydroxymethyldihydropteridine diphosphokinase
MILIGLGANLPHPRHGPPRATLEAVLRELEAAGVAVTARSRWYATSPVPASDQPEYVNGVAAVETTQPPGELLALLHRIEAAFGRVRTVRNAARAIDLDLLAYHEIVDEVGPPVLPHPRLAERAFVLLPLRDVAPGWVDPRSGRGLQALLRDLPPGQSIRPLDEPGESGNRP